MKYLIYPQICLDLLQCQNEGQDDGVGFKEFKVKVA